MPPSRQSDTGKHHASLSENSHKHSQRTFASTLLCLCVAVGTEKQCELTCRPAGYRFYVSLAERVRDGTPCFNVTSNDLCVEGRCMVGAFTFARAWYAGMEPVQGAGSLA